MADSNLPNLETSLAEITSIVDKMEKSDLTLEQSLTNFERGIHLVKHCQKILAQAEQKVQLLVQTNNQENLTTYNDEQNVGADDKQTAQ